MIAGLFPTPEREIVLGVAERSIAFLTPDTAYRILRKAAFRQTAWTIANVYLGSLGAATFDGRQILGYSIGCRTGRDGQHHASVEIHRESFRRLRQHLEAIALRQDVGQLIQLLQLLGFAPYARVRRQLLKLLWHVNQRRHRAGLEPIPWSVIQWKRRPVSPFPRSRSIGGDRVAGASRGQQRRRES